MTGNAIVLQHVSLARALAMSALGPASKTDKSPGGFANKKDRMWERVVRQRGNPNMPLFTWATFKVKKNETDGSPMIDVTVEIPDPEGSSMDVTVFARPHILADGLGGMLPYFTTVEVEVGGVKKRRPMETSHLCEVLKPAPNKRTGFMDPYRVVPLALGSTGPEGALTRWNLAAATALANAPDKDKEAVSEQWPVIEPFEHALHLDHHRNTLVLNYKPDGHYPVNEKDPKSDRTYGTLFGQRIIDGSKPDDEFGVPPEDVLYSRHTFQILGFSENAIRVRWLGPEGATRIKRGTIRFDHYALNGFEALGLNVVTANPRKVHEYAKWFANGVLDEGNLLYMYALGRAEVTEGQPVMERRTILRQIGETAATQIQNELNLERTALHDYFTTAILPTLEEALAGGDLTEVWYRESGEDDVVAQLIAQKVETEFSWDSWLHTRVRLDVLAQIASKASISPPARPVVVKKDESVPEVPPPAAEESAPAEQAAADASEDADDAEGSESAEEEKKGKKPRRSRRASAKDIPSAPVA